MHVSHSTEGRIDEVKHEHEGDSACSGSVLSDETAKKTTIGRPRIRCEGGSSATVSAVISVGQCREGAVTQVEQLTADENVYQQLRPDTGRE